MAQKILIVPDKFKGTLSATGVAEALARGWCRIRPGDTLELLPMSDGGEGFGEVMGRLFGAEMQTVRTVDAAHRPVTARWWWAKAARIAILESAEAIGLALLPAGKFHPHELDTRGLGKLLQAAVSAGAKRCLMGIGGSATNDGGFGVARTLGWRFFDQHDREIHRWTELHSLARLESPKNISVKARRVSTLQGAGGSEHAKAWTPSSIGLGGHDAKTNSRTRPRTSTPFKELVVAVDVQNPLLGPSGCTRVYGPQKGLRATEFEMAERCLAQLASIVERQPGCKCADEPGAGAAGGLGFGLRCFVGARLESGFELFSRHADLAKRIRAARLVLTGEGRVDEQTLMGKGVGALAEMCQTFKVPCLVFAGGISPTAQPAKLFQRVYALSPEFASRERALAEPAACLELAATAAAKEFGV